MSLSQQKVVNPVEKWIGYKGGDGIFSYYCDEQQQKVELELPLRFIVLDEMIKVSGYHKPTNGGIYSNEVRSTRNEPLHVQQFKGVDELKGYYSEIKDSIVAWGGKFTKSVYCALITPGGYLEMVNIQFKGAAFSAWLSYTKKKNLADWIISITDTEPATNGSIQYQIPVFSKEPITDKLLQDATQMDIDLQNYFQSRAENNEPADNGKSWDAERKSFQEPPGKAITEKMYRVDDDLGKDLPVSKPDDDQKKPDDDLLNGKLPDDEEDELPF